MYDKLFSNRYYITAPENTIVTPYGALDGFLANYGRGITARQQLLSVAI